jgi:hypothetical protein
MRMFRISKLNNIKKKHNIINKLTRRTKRTKAHNKFNTMCTPFFIKKKFKNYKKHINPSKNSLYFKEASHRVLPTKKAVFSKVLNFKKKSTSTFLNRVQLLEIYLFKCQEARHSILFLSPKFETFESLFKDISESDFDSFMPTVHWCVEAYRRLQRWLIIKGTNLFDVCTIFRLFCRV